MRLSEAIMLGSTQTHLSATNWDHCLIGMGFHALAGLQTDICIDDTGAPVEAYARWPWLQTFIQYPPPELVGGIRGTGTASQIISGLAGRVVRGDVSLEAAVDWIRSVEPQEEPVQIPETIKQEELEIA